MSQIMKPNVLYLKTKGSGRAVGGNDYLKCWTLDQSVAIIFVACLCNMHTYYSRTSKNLTSKLLALGYSICSICLVSKHLSWYLVYQVPENEKLLAQQDDPADL